MSHLGKPSFNTPKRNPKFTSDGRQRPRCKFRDVCTYKMENDYCKSPEPMCINQDFSDVPEKVTFT